MSHSAYRSSPFDTYNPSFDLQPLFSTLSALLIGTLLVLITASTFLGLAPWTAPLDTLVQLGEMVSLGISSLLGKGGLSKLDWTQQEEWGGGNDADTSTPSASNGTAAQRKKRLVRTAPSRVASAGGSEQYFPGLLNAAGNLCYLNATLQSMASLPSLLVYLDQLVTSASEADLSLPVSTALLATLDALNTPSASRPQPLRPVELASALADSSPSRRRLLATSEQQDAHELWGMIRDAVEDEAKRLAVVQEQLAARGTGLAEAATLLSGLGAALRKRRSGKLETDPWFWLQSQRVRCMECGYVRDTRHVESELLMLQVPLVAHCSLHDLLAEYTKADLISGFNCRRCAILSTLARLEAQRDRLALMAAPNSPPSSQAALNPFELPPNSEEDGKSKKMTASRKERRRKAQKLVDRLKTIADAADWERDPGPDIRLDKSDSAASKTNRFARTPELLAVHLSRSTHYGYSGAIKNSCQVSCPEYLNLAPFCDGVASARSGSQPAPSSAPDLRDVYRLASLVVHYGSHSFGHYVAFRRRPDLSAEGISADSEDEPVSSIPMPEWYRVSDETVDPASINEALRANPFLLFYERLRDDRPATRPNGDQLGTGLSAIGALAGGVSARVVESWRAAQRRTLPDVVVRKEGPSERDEVEAPELSDGL